jgi:Domain of unknown function (DUF4747)
MASFRLYNIQLLPLDTAKTPEVGEQGYRKLFSLLREFSLAVHKTKALAESSYKLPHDTYFAPFTVVAGEKFAEGKWVKFQRADAVVDLYTNESLYTAGKGDAAVSNNYFFRFIFDYEVHRLAVEELQGKLPSANSLLDALDSILRPIADQNFPEYTLTVNLVSESKALEVALAEAVGFRHVEVRVTFPNGELSSRLRQMKDNNVHVVKAEASSDKNALMPKLPDFILEMVRASTDYGRSKFTYFKKKLARKQTFSTERNPEKIRLRSKKGEQEASFMERVRERLKTSAVTPDQNPAEQE